jgi:phage shock protein A
MSEIEKPADGGTEEPEQSDTQEEFGELFRDVQAERERLMKLAKAAKDEGKGDIAAVYGEMAGTVLQLVQDVIGSTGGALDTIEQTLDELDPAESHLTEDDAKEYLQVFSQVTRLLDELEKSVPESATEQRELFQALRRLVEDREEFTREISGLEDDDDPAEPVPEVTN